MSVEGNAPVAAHSRVTYSCVRCSSRKVKCDRKKPCNQCLKRDEDCIFNTQPPQRKRKRVKVQNLTNRLKYYESLLQTQGFNLAKLSDALEPEPQGKPSQNTVIVPRDIQPQLDSSVRTRAEQYVDETQAPDTDVHFRFVEK